LDFIENWDTPKIMWLGLGATAGIVCQALCLVWALKRAGFKYRPVFGLRGFGLRHFAKVSLWSLLLVLLEELSALVVFKIIANAPLFQSGEMSEMVAGNAALNQATTIYIVPYSLVTVSLATALFTKMSRAHSERNLEGAVQAFSYGARITTLVSWFSSAAFFILAEPITKLLIPSLSVSGVNIVGSIVQYQSLGYFGLSIALLAKRFYFAHHQPQRAFWITVPITLIQLGIAFGLQFLVPPEHLAEMIALGLALTSILATILYVRDLVKFFHTLLDLANITIVLIKSLIAGGLSAGLGWLLTLAWPIDLNSNYFLVLAQTGVIALIMLGVYLGVLSLLRTSEVKILFDRFKSKLK
jgi:putative peptidoglycan lipid II flippase